MSDLAPPTLWPTATVETRLAVLRKSNDSPWTPDRFDQTLSKFS